MSAFSQLPREKIAQIADRAPARTVSLLDAKPKLAAATSKGENVRSSVLPNESHAFSLLEVSLIRKLHGILSVQKLLEVLNERREADQPGCAPHTLAQLTQELNRHTTDSPSSEGGWTNLRKTLAQAQRSGVLGRINKQVIDDFAVVFSLTPGQVLHLQDVLLSDEDGAE